MRIGDANRSYESFMRIVTFSAASEAVPSPRTLFETGFKCYRRFVPPTGRCSFDFPSPTPKSSSVPMLSPRQSILAVLLALSAIYVVDDVSIRYHIPSRREPFATITVQRYDAIPEKNGKVEFGF